MFPQKWFRRIIVMHRENRGCQKSPNKKIDFLETAGAKSMEKTYPKTDTTFMENHEKYLKIREKKKDDGKRF